jgi:hypothetical protein
VGTGVGGGGCGKGLERHPLTRAVRSPIPMGPVPEDTVTSMRLYWTVCSGLVTGVGTKD